MSNQIRGKPEYHIDNLVGTKTAVQCNSQEEWDAVRVLIPNARLSPQTYRVYADKISCIHTDNYGGSYGHLQFYKGEGYKIITAAEFLAANTQPGREYVVGQWVYLLTERLGAKVGDIRQLQKWDGHHWMLNNVGGYEKWYIDLHEMRPATEQEIAQVTGKDGWKVGDKLPKNWLDQQKYYRFEKNGTLCMPSGNFYEGSYVERVEDGKALISNTEGMWLPPKHQCTNCPGTQCQFKVGDRVRRTVCPGGSISVGDEGTVQSFHQQGEMMIVQWDKGKQEGCAVKYAALIHQQVAYDDIKVGDWVYIINGGCRTGKGYTGHLLTGNVYQIEEVIHSSTKEWQYKLKGNPFDTTSIKHSSMGDKDQYIRKALPHEIPTISSIPVTVENAKVGMKIICTDKYYKQWSSITGKEGTIIEIGNSHNSQTGRVLIQFNGNKLWADYNEIYIAPTETTIVPDSSSDGKWGIGDTFKYEGKGEGWTINRITEDGKLGIDATSNLYTQQDINGYVNNGQWVCMNRKSSTSNSKQSINNSNQQKQQNNEKSTEYISTAIRFKSHLRADIKAVTSPEGGEEYTAKCKVQSKIVEELNRKDTGCIGYGHRQKGQYIG